MPSDQTKERLTGREAEERHADLLENHFPDHQHLTCHDRETIWAVFQETVKECRDQPKGGVGRQDCETEAELREALAWAVDWIECEGKPDGFDPKTEPENWNAHFDAGIALKRTGKKPHPQLVSVSLEEGWPAVVLSRPTPEADPENYEVYPTDNAPAADETQRYIPAALAVDDLLVPGKGDSSSEKVVGTEVPGDPQNAAYSLPQWLTFFAQRIERGEPVAATESDRGMAVILRTAANLLYRLPQSSTQQAVPGNGEGSGDAGYDFSEREALEQAADGIEGLGAVGLREWSELLLALNVAGLELRRSDAGSNTWRTRAVAHAKALASMLSVQGVTAGTFGETWLHEAQETVRLDLGQTAFAAGAIALHKDGSLTQPAVSEVPGDKKRVKMVECGCEAPAMVTDQGVCTGCGAQVIREVPGNSGGAEEAAREVVEAHRCLVAAVTPGHPEALPASTTRALRDALTPPSSDQSKKEGQR